jgi:N-acetylneuraminic acid mutarotase
MKTQNSRTRLIGFFLLFIFVLFQSSCGTKSSVSPTPVPATDTPTLTVTIVPTSTATPSQTSAPTAQVIGMWSQGPSMLSPRSAHAVVSSNSFIYALAGTNDKGKPVLDIESFDGEQWKVETTLPGQGLNATAAVILGDKLYVLGGFKVVSNQPTDDVHIYDLQTHEWSMASPMPNPRGGHAALVLDGKIHLIGGGNSVSTIPDHSQYDPATDSWRDLAQLPRSEGSPAAVVVDGKIYAIGGRSGFSDFGDVYIYDSISDTWSTGRSIEPRGTAGAVVYCGGVYVFGGESQSQRKNLDSVLRLDLERNVWETVTSMPEARNFARAVLFMDSVYIVGGSTKAASSHASIGTASVLKFMQAGCP